MSDLMHGLAELDDALPSYLKAESFYEGTAPEYFANRRLARKLAVAGERFRINFAKTPVNVVADRLKVAALTVPGDDAATAVLSEVWDANDMDLHAPNLTLRACEYGDSYAIVWPVSEGDINTGAADGEDLDEESDASDEQLEDASVEITYVSPLFGRMIYDDERPNRKAYFVMRWMTAEKRIRVNLYYPDRVERWIAQEGTKGDQRAQWLAFGEDVPNPFGEIPVFHFRNGAQYGTPEHVDAYGPQDMINKLAVTQMATTDAHGFPQRWALAEAGTALDTNPDGDDDDDDWETEGGALASERTNRLTSEPGGIQMLQGIKSTGQYNEADPDVFLKPFELYVRSMAQVTTTPYHYFDPTGDAPSGESLRTANAPLDNKLERRKAWFGSTFAELARFALLLRGFEVPMVDVRWQPDAVLSDDSAWSVIEKKQRNGVPMRQTLLEAGYSSEQVDEWLSSNEAELDLMRRVEILDKIGDAVQKLGSGVGFGLLTSEQAASVVERIVGQLTPETEAA